MEENLPVEVEEDKKEVGRTITRIPTELREDGGSLQLKNRHARGIILAKAKQSYALRRGTGSLRHGFRSLRWEHRRRLRDLLRRLVRQHNWDEASGVLSVLLKGSRKEASVANNRFKYWATMELLTQIKGECINSRKVQHIYELWMKKIGFMKNWPVKDRFEVQLEFILFCLSHGLAGDAHQAIIGLMQEREFGIDPISNLVVGLTFFQLWYHSIPEELQLRNVDESYVSMESEMLKTEVDMSLDNPDRHDTAEVKEAKFSVEYGSNTSIRIDKKNCLEPDADQQKEVFVEVDNNLYGESTYKHFQMQEISVTAERSGHEESSFSIHSGDIPNTSIFYAHGLQPWLFPIRWHNSNKNMEYLIYMHRTLRNDYYKNAIKYLRLALYSTPPAFEALLPLVQILLVGDQAEKALAELEKFGRSSSTTLTSKLKAHLLEHLDGNNYVKLSTCFEDILMKDPACIYSLERLISMHQSGDYSTEKLVEMVALHLDASYAESKIWKVFSSCFLNLSLCEEDRISTCLDSSKEVPHKQNYSRRLNRLPGTFTDGVFRKEWRVRCRWWLTRHFSQSIFASDVDSGDPWMLAYKAACACHLYVQELEYVVKASASLKQEKYTDMLAFLQMHKQNSVGFYLNFERKPKL